MRPPSQEVLSTPASQDTGQSRTSLYRRNQLAMLAGLMLLVALAYGDSLGNWFTMDDDFIIVDNPMIRSLRTLPRLFATDYWAREGATDHLVPRTTGLYRPLVLTSYALNYQMTGLQPWSYHLVNLVLHALCTWVTFLIALRIGLSMQGAAIGAAIFALHPLHTEVVSGIVGRAELLMTAGVLAALWFAAEGRLWLSLGVFLAGLFSKEQTVMLPTMVVLYDLCIRKRPPNQHTVKGRARHKAEPLLARADLRRYASYFLVLGGYLLARGLALGTLELPLPAFLDNPLAYVGAGERILTALKVAGHYLWLFIWPTALSADYSYNAIPVTNSLGDPGVFLAVLAWGGLAVWMVGSYLKRDRRIAFCIGFMILAFLPVSNVLVPIGTIMGERLFYLPSAGLCWLAGVLWDRFRVHAGQREWARIAGGVIVMLVCLAFLVRTAWRNFDWADNGTLFRSAGKVVSSSAKIRAYQGRVSQADRDWPQAGSHYEAAMQIYPEYAQTDASLNVNVGDVYFKLGRLEQAAEALERAIRLAPSSPEAHYNLGLVYARLGRYKDSEPMVRTALTLKPDFPEAQNTLSRLLVEFGRYQDALAAADEALKRRPDFREALYNRGLALRGLGRIQEAEVAFRQADGRGSASQPIPGALGGQK